jgi:hypothetical protein
MLLSVNVGTVKIMALNGIGNIMDSRCLLDQNLRDVSAVVVNQLALAVFIMTMTIKRKNFADGYVQNVIMGLDY